MEINYTPLRLYNKPEAAPVDLQEENSSSFAKKFFFFFFFLTFFLFTAFISVIALAGYTNINLPGINSQIRNRIKIMLAKMPLLPKTQDQVLLASIAKAKTTTSFDMKSSGVIEISDPSSTSLSVEFSSDNQMEYKNKKMRIKGKTDAALNVTVDNFKFSAEYIMIGSDLYFKITSLPYQKILSYLKAATPISPDQEALLNKIISKITDKWISIESDVLDTEAKKELDQELAKDQFKSLYQDNLSILTDPTIKEKINFVANPDNYEFTLALTGKEIRKILKQLIYKEGKILTEKENEELDIIEKSFKKATLRFVVSKKFDLQKTSITLLIEAPEENQATDRLSAFLPSSSMFGSKGNIKIAFSSSFSNFNEPKDIEVPAATPIGDLFREIQLELISSINNNQRTSTSEDWELDFKKKELAQNLILELSQYYSLNGKYPRSINDLFVTNNNQDNLSLYNQLGISYVVSTEQDSYLLFYWNNTTQNYTVYKNGQLLSQGLSSKELNDEISKIKKNVLGAFTERLQNLIPSPSPTPTP